MTSIDRSNVPWVGLTWGILATAAWAFNAVIAVTIGSAPSMDVLLVALSLTMTGMSIGVTVNVIVGLIRSRRPPRRDDMAADEAALWGLPMGAALLGFAVWPLLEPLNAVIDWVLLVVGTLAGGFVIGTVAGARLRRYISTAARPGGPPVTPGTY